VACGGAAAPAIERRLCTGVRTDRENALTGIAAAAEALSEAQNEAARMLPIIGSTRIPAPEPLIEACAPEPLFCTGDDFTTASRKLIAESRLDGGAS
jgi:hypothetical protein